MRECILSSCLMKKERKYVRESLIKIYFEIVVHSQFSLIAPATVVQSVSCLFNWKSKKRLELTPAR